MRISFQQFWNYRFDYHFKDAIISIVNDKGAKRDDTCGPAIETANHRPSSWNGSARGMVHLRVAKVPTHRPGFLRIAPSARRYAFLDRCKRAEMGLQRVRMPSGRGDARLGRRLVGMGQAIRRALSRF
jgi:hypothetical protein